jgi:phosphoglycerol transferase MdoB-like AlkP superfamily enzyme
MHALGHLLAFLFILFPLTLNRVSLLVLQQKSLGLVAPFMQMCVGIANDGFIAALLYLLLLAAWHGTPQRSVIRRALVAFIYLLCGLVFLFTLANTAFVFYSGQNIGLHELSYYKDLPILWDSVSSEIHLRSLMLWLVLCYCLIVAGCLVQASSSRYRLPPGSTRRQKWALLGTVVLLGLSFRSFSLSKRTVLHEPVETHVLPYLAWSYRLAKKFQITKPQHGAALLANYQRQLAALETQVGSFPHLPPGQNVVLIVLESFGWGKLHEKPSIAPFTMSLLQDPHSIVLGNHFTTVYRTIGAQYSLLCSRHDPLSFYVIRDFPHKKSLCLPEYLAGHGYHSLWVSGSKPEFDYNAEWLGGHQVAELFSEQYFLPLGGAEKHFSYGVHDEVPLSQFADLLSTQAEPFFTYLLTISNHHPWVFPEDFAKAHPELKHFSADEVGFYYTDIQLEKFFTMARSTAWFDRTLFVVVGDHAPWGYEAAQPEEEQDYAYFRRRYHTSALFWHSSFSARTISADTSHVDIPSTLLAMLDIPRPEGFVGQNVFAPRLLPHVGSQDNNRDSVYQIHSPGEIIRVDVKSAACSKYQAESKGKFACDTDDRRVVNDFKEAFYDTVQWEFGGNY